VVRRSGAPGGGNASCPLDKHLGSRLRALRSSMGLDEEQAAAALHVSVADLRRYEAGEGRLSSIRLLQLAGLLGVPLTALFAAPPRETAQSVLRHIREMAVTEPVRPDQRELLDFLRAWLGIADEGKRARMVEALGIAADVD
jgi:transcriptional regulator with XRE-family HTH domain